MHRLYHTYQPPQIWRPLQASGTCLPQRFKVQPPMKGTFCSSLCQEPHPAQPTPTSGPPLQHNAVATQEPVSRGYEPTQYTLDDGPRGGPGTSAYYKSWAFRQKVNKGKVMVAKREDEVGETFNDSSDEDCIRKRKPIPRRTSLIMVFSRTNVRRASTQRKVNKRTQRFNRRTKFLRKVERTKPLFSWD